MDKHQILSGTSFGQRVAEEEADALVSYFVETDHWKRIHNGEVDIVYGPKGAGKSAIYSLLVSRQEDFRNRGVFLLPAENLRGAPAFKNLTTAPLITEREFVSLWKLYFATLLHDMFVRYEVRGASFDQLQEALQREGLVKGTLSLAGVLSAVAAYVRRAFRPQSLEAGLNIDPTTQMPSGLTGKIVFSEPTDGADHQLRSVDRLLELANDTLDASGISSWLLLDRLDVAFSENTKLETNALRGLFRVYLDMLAYSKIKIKIFLRSDIWARITADGFREASHVTRHLTIGWNKNSLLNLVVRRAVHNEAIREAYAVDSQLAKAPASEQERFFYRVFPEQVEIGPSKSATLDWLLSRTRDGTRINAPRELIHLLNSLRDVQVQRFELGDEPVPEGEQLFARVAFKAAMPEVSKVRLEQTLFAEHPDRQPWLTKLRGEKTSQTPETLAVIWGLEIPTAAHVAWTLANIGFFEQRGTKQLPEFWVPFLYRDALDMVQGTAD
jgi:hypothetical protein